MRSTRSPRLAALLTPVLLSACAPDAPPVALEAQPPTARLTASPPQHAEPQAARPPALTSAPKPAPAPPPTPAPTTPAPTRAPDPPRTPPTLRARSVACARLIKRTLQQIARHEEAACHIMHDRLKRGLPMSEDHPTRSTSMCEVGPTVDGGGSSCDALKIWQRPAGECASLLQENARHERPTIEAGSGYWAYAKYAPMRATLQRDQSLTITSRVTVGDCRSEDHDSDAHLRSIRPDERDLSARAWHRRPGERLVYRAGDVIMELRGVQHTHEWGYPVDLGGDAYDRLYGRPAQRKIIAALESCALGSSPR